MAISLQQTVGQTLEQITIGANAPAAGAGAIEVRIDQTANAITDASYPGGRAVKRSEVIVALLQTVERLQKDDAGALFLSG